METNRFVCMALAIDGGVIDNICDEFGIDFDEEEVLQAIKDGINYEWGPGKCLLMTLFGKIMAEYSELDEDKFEYDFTSPSSPSFYYDCKEFRTKRELDSIAGRV